MFKFVIKIILGSVVVIDYLIDVNILEYSQFLYMNLNEIGVVDVKFIQFVFCDLYKCNCVIGVFIVIDCLINGIVGVGMIIDELVKDKLYGVIEFLVFELEFNELVCKYFFYWNVIDISKLQEQDFIRWI